MTLFGESYAAPRMDDVSMFLEAGGHENVGEWAADNGFCEVFVRGASHWEHTDRPGEGPQDIDEALIVAVEEQSE